MIFKKKSIIVIIIKIILGQLIKKLEKIDILGSAHVLREVIM